MTDLPFYIDANDPPAKRRILEEGLRLFAEKGLSATSVRDIAATTGYTNPALYKHFKTKEALALALFERCYGEWVARLDRVSREARERGEGFAGVFRAQLEAFARLYDAHPAAVIFTTDNLAPLWLHVPKAMTRRTLITLTREMLEEGREEGLVAKDADLELQIALISGYLGQVTRQLWLGAMKGPALSLVAKSERILRAGLS